MSKIWVIAAESSCARILEADTPLGGLREIEILENPTARARQRELASDRPGRSFDSGGQGRHAMESEIDPKRQEVISFAKQIAARIEEGRVSGIFGELILIADPKFLGHLRQSVSGTTTQLISRTIDKDPAGMDAATIREHLI